MGARTMSRSCVPVHELRLETGVMYAQLEILIFPKEENSSQSRMWYSCTVCWTS